MQAIWLDTQQPLSAEDLAKEDVSYEKLPVEKGRYEERLKAIMAERGYVTMDEVGMKPDMENFDALCRKFIEEHLHTDDEVRFVLQGSGVFEIRSRDDRWMKLTVFPGDFLSVPANRYHRFYLTDEKRIHCVRLFKDASGWVPHYRKEREAASST